MKRNVIANVAGTGWSALMGFAFLPVYIHLLGIEAWGLVGFFLTLQVWLSLLEMGLSPAVNREMAQFVAGTRGGQEVADMLKSAERVYLLMAAAAFVLVAASAPWLASEWLRAPTLPRGVVANGIACMGLVIACQWMASLYRNALLGLQRFVAPNALSAAFATLRAGCTIAALAWIASDIQLYFVVQMLVVALEALALRFVLHRALPNPPEPASASLASLRPAARFAIGVAAVAVLSNLTSQVDKLVLTKLLPLDQFGYFMLAVTVASALGIVIGPVYTAAYPRLSELAARADGHGFARTYQDFSQLLAVCLAPPALMFAFHAFDIVHLWSGDAVLARNVAPLLSVWVVGTLFNGVMHLPYAAQLAHGWPRLSMAMNAGTALLVIPLTLAVVPRWGPLGAAWIWTSVNFVSLVAGLILMHKRILHGEMLSWLWNAFAMPLATALVSTACLYWLFAQLPLNGNRVLAIAALLFQALLVLAATAVVTPLARSVAREAVARLGTRASI